MAVECKMRTGILLALVLARAASLGPQPRSVAAIYKESIETFHPESFAATPIKKRRVAVCGAGGKAGAFVFGHLQRAAVTFEAGLGAPRALVGAARGSRALNAVLGSHFILAFAGEDLVKRTDFADTAVIAQRLGVCDVVVVPSRLSSASAVTGTEWTWDADSSGGDPAAFEAVLAAAVASDTAVVAVAPAADAAAVEKALDDSAAAYTLVVVDVLEPATKSWNLNKGVTNAVDTGAAGALTVEDLGALIAQAAAVCDLGARRKIVLGSSPAANAAPGEQEALHARINAALRA